MADNSGISWTNATWGPVTGCSKVSPACKFCYAERDWPRLAGNEKTVYFNREFTDVAWHPERFDQPLRWQKPRLIFVNSMSDLFHEDIPDEVIDRIYAVMKHAHWHIFQVLTKRHARMRAYLTAPGRAAAWARAANELGLKHKHPMRSANPEYCGEDFAEPHANVWLGVSVENQEMADVRIPLLLATPAAVRWISMEPLLGEVRLDEHALHGGPGQIDWVVVGGESGAKARPMHYRWVRQLRKACNAANVPFFFKQTGLWQMIEEGNPAPEGAEIRYFPNIDATCYKSHGGGSEELDGELVHEYPPEFNSWLEFYGKAA